MWSGIGFSSARAGFACRQYDRTASTSLCRKVFINRALESKSGPSSGLPAFVGRTTSFTFASEMTLTAGERLSVIAPGSQDASLADLSITSRARGPNSPLDGTGWAATPLTVLVLDKDGVNVGITLVHKPLTWNILPDVVVRRWRDPRALFYEYPSGSMW